MTRVRCVLGMLGTDVHTKGIRTLARHFRDAGIEVVYLGEHNTPEGFAAATAAEDADIVGLSFSTASYLYYVEELMKAMASAGLAGVPVMVGGLIHTDDEPTLRGLGVAGIFGPGSTTESILDFVLSIAARPPEPGGTVSTDVSHPTTTEYDGPLSAEVRESMRTADYYLRQDRGTVPEALFEQSTEDLGDEPLDKGPFVDRSFHELEKVKLWKRVWQMACRENDIPEVGDRCVYDIVDQSVVVVRSGPDEIKAFHNTCMHRGTRLVDPEVGDPLQGQQLTCSFHKWSYNLDGSIKQIPCRWDFPLVRDADVHLSEVRTATWNGFVFVNLDPEAPPFEEFLGETIPRHFKSWPRHKAYKAAHIGKVVPCNWKLAAEAFLEIYHIVATHPNFLPYSADCNAQYDFWGRHARMMGIVGVSSPHLGELDDPQMIVDGMLGDAVGNMFGEGEFEMPQLPEGATEMDARRLCADFVRESMGKQFGQDFSGASDTEMLDATQYFVFPNFIPWAGNAFPMAYRVRPNGDDHESCIFEVLVMMWMPGDDDPPKDSPLKMTPADRPWGEVAELGGLGPIIDQDMVNLVKFQRGMRSDGIKQVHFANYQERNIRNLHRNLGRFLNG